MNKTLCSLCLLALFSLSAYAQEEPNPRFIEVTGTAEIQADVDQATWTISLREEAPNLAEASQGLEAHTDQLQQSITAAGFPENTLRLSDIRSGKDYEHTPQGRKFLGYYAQRSISVQLDDLKKRQMLETILLGNDSIEIHQIQTKSSKHQALKEELLQAALVAAKAKAEKLATEASVTLGKINYIKEGSSGMVGPVNGQVMRASAEAGGIDSFDQIQYNATVVVSFSISDQR